MEFSEDREKLLGFYGAGVAFGKVIPDIGVHSIKQAL